MVSETLDSALAGANLPAALCFFPAKGEHNEKNSRDPRLAVTRRVDTLHKHAPAQTKNPVSSALRDILPGRQKNTIAAVEAMPADKFNYKPTADQMTFGHLVAHMVEANNGLCSKAAAVPAPKVEAVKESDSKDKLVAALKASFDFLLRHARENGRLETNRDHGRLRRKTGYAGLVQPGPSQRLGRPLRRGRNVFAPERHIAADREEVRLGWSLAARDGRDARPSTI